MPNSKAIAALVHEHEIILEVVEGLGRLAAALRAEREVDVATLREAVGFMRAFADKCHHAKEEDLLFPALVDAGVPDGGGPVGVLKAEHVQARVCVAKFADGVECYARGEPAAAEMIAHAIACIGGLYPQHIAKENNVLFPKAERVLSGPILERLNERFEETEAALGAEVHHRFAAFAKRLERDTAPVAV